MANKFFQQGAQRAPKVQDLFSAIAPRYDLINDLQSFGLHRFWKQRLLDAAGLDGPSRILDLCCGTGDISLSLAARGANSVGLDFSAPMLAVAEARAQATHRSVAWVNGDALRLPFTDSQFDAVIISYGLRNLADIERGLREMYRVARPGGRLLVLDFGKPRQRWLRAAYFAYLRYWVPWFGRLLCGEAATYGYILESLRHYPAQEGVAALMSKLNCQHVRIVNLLGGIMSINSGVKPPADSPVCTDGP